MSKKETIGLVVSSKMNKTIVVAITSRIAHKKYNKIISKTNKYYAHDENNECSAGDKVIIKESRPISKNKRWILIKKII